MTARLLPTHPSVTLGVLAGGEGSRLGGRDKAWLERGGTPLVVALVDGLAAHVDAVLVSANRNPENYLSHGLRAIHDEIHGIGPLGGLHALAIACRTDWLLTLPVDVLALPGDLIQRLQAGEQGNYAVDDDGPQPLVARWRVVDLRRELPAAIASGDHAVHQLQARLDMTPVRFEQMRFGNLNSPEDLAAAGVEG
ncbi:molybdenum cofactor guanylyltransferase [Luteimonas vadosa]|uniref:Molybdenum cofactor guanylyltransferase n=1 Tax=Luteimonas vadosa TaxID=1165507 RepID=A0ABP9E6U3_9GAMM